MKYEENNMIRIKDVVTKPSEALQAMVDGLLEQDSRPDFVVNMMSFGNIDLAPKNGKMDFFCCGCAATCAIQKIAGKNLTPASIGYLPKRAKKLSINKRELEIFEHVIDKARKGYLFSLFEYFEIVINPIASILHTDYYLGLDNWKKGIPAVKEKIKELAASGY